MMVQPALLIGFNRPKRIRAALRAIESSGIRDLYIHLDGARDGRVSDYMLTKEVLQICLEFRTCFESFEINAAPVNLGCGPAVISGINWFLDETSAGIIIEDDIIVTKNFVDFASLSLQTYNENENVWHINGWSPNNGKQSDNLGFGTRYALPWGWATWSEKWNYHNKATLELNHLLPSDLPTNKGQKLSREFDQYWTRNFNLAKTYSRDIWDYQWIRKIWSNGAIAISPPFRMTTNTGFSKDSTHTFRPLRKQLSSFKINKEWSLPENPILGLNDYILGELTFNDEIGNSILNTARLRSLISEKPDKIKAIHTLKYINIRETMFEYLSYSGIKLSFINFLKFAIKILKLRIIKTK